MKIKTLYNKIIKMGGKADLVYKDDHKEPVELIGELNGYDIEMNTERFYTSREIEKRGYYDAGSDYNPNGYHFHYKIKELEWLAT